MMRATVRKSVFWSVAMVAAHFAVGTAEAAAATGPIVADDPSLGINPPPPEANAWRASTMDFPAGPSDDDRCERPGEFFELEYGEPVAPFSFTNGFSRLWGASRNDQDLPGVRFGRGWGDYAMCKWAVVAEVDQSAGKSDWELWMYRGRRSERKCLTFLSPGGGLAKCFLPMGVIHPDRRYNGFRLSCTTNSPVHGTVRSLRFVCFGVPAAYRRTFDLPSAPAFAGLTVPGHPQSRVVVNGKEVFRAVPVENKFGIVKLDITGGLRAGANEVRYEFDAAAGWGDCETAADIELFAVDERGTTAFLGGDGKWECKYGEKAWRSVRLGGRAGLRRQRNGNAYAFRPLPLHAGALQVKPHGEKYPVFDADGEVAWDVWCPAGVEAPSLRAVVKDSFTGEVVEARDFGTVTTVRFETRRTGAYDVEWTLSSGGRAIDAYSSEMVVAGPVGGEEYALEAMEGELARRKRPVCEIDPTEGRWFSLSSNFLAHTGGFAKPQVDMGRCVEAAGRRVRETGPSDGAYFAWSVSVGTLGAPHLVEIDYPDTREQVIYSALVETYPCDMINNASPYENGYANATGAVKTGDREPLSGKIRTLRYVFFPGSRNATVTFESGLDGKPAACAAIRIYEVDGGLPAWKRPETGRLFMNHNERILFGHWGAWRSPLVFSTASWTPELPLQWSAAFAAARNRVTQLRFEGHNAAIEGVYMYKQGFPTRSGESATADDGYDFAWLVAKMYRHNGIKFFAGFEYLASPKLARDGVWDVSERDVWSGRGQNPAHHVDRNGRIVEGFNGMGLNDRHPAVRASMSNLVEEIHARYDGLGVEGMFLVSGGWWLPGFPTTDQMSPDDIGFDDATTAAFERETGIFLGTGTKGRGRFARRHRLLTGRHSAEWRRWRARRMRSSLEEVQSVLDRGRDRWRLYVMPFVRLRQDNAFMSPVSTPYMRDTQLERLWAEAGYDAALYGAGSSTSVRLLPYCPYTRPRDFLPYGMKVSRGARELYRRNDAVYFAPDGLNERGYSTTAAAGSPWWWRNVWATVFDVKFSGEAAYSDFVDVLAGYTPQMLVHTWTDCNCNTAHDAALRNFLSGFYATPPGDGEPYAAVKGATARIYGGKMQLVNDTPYASRGTVSGVGTVELPPYAVKVLEKPGAGAFRYDPDVEGRILAEASSVLSDNAIMSRLRDGCAERLRLAATGRDAYSACMAMRDWEVAVVLRRAKASSSMLERQRRLEGMLAGEGAARIDCGSAADVMDERGRLWLADQAYTGFGAYGHIFANIVDRGTIPISNTDIPSIYRTEAGCTGRLFYRIPVPAGRYRVSLHFAETWDTAPGRVMDVTVGGVTREVAPWDAGGRCAASVCTWEDVQPVDGAIDVSIVRGSPILNGIEIGR